MLPSVFFMVLSWLWQIEREQDENLSFNTLAQEEKVSHYFSVTANKRDFLVIVTTIPFSLPIDQTSAKLPTDNNSNALNTHGDTLNNF